MRRRLLRALQAAWAALLVCAVSVGASDEDDCPGDVECVVVVEPRPACEGVCIGIGGFLDQQREDEFRRGMEIENRAALGALMSRHWQTFEAEMFVIGIMYCVAHHAASGVPADVRAKTSIVIEDLPIGQLGEARRTVSGNRLLVVIDLEENRVLASTKGAPLAQMLSMTVLHEFVHLQYQDMEEPDVLRIANRRYHAMFGMPAPLAAGYSAVKHAKVATC